MIKIQRSELFSKPTSSPSEEQFIIERLESMGTDYVSNFYTIVEKHVATGGPFNIGECMLSYLGRNRKVPLVLLTKMNCDYYNTYDKDLETKLEYEKVLEELRLEYYN